MSGMAVYQARKPPALSPDKSSVKPSQNPSGRELSEKKSPCHGGFFFYILEESPQRRRKVTVGELIELLEDLDFDHQVLGQYQDRQGNWVNIPLARVSLVGKNSDLVVIQLARKEDTPSQSLQ